MKITCRLLALAWVLCITTRPLAQDAAVATPSDLSIPSTDDGLPGAGPIRRYDWFKNLWNQRREAWAKQVDADQGAVVFLGDSITQGWGDDMHGDFADLKVANRGISGDTTRGMLIRLEKDVLALQPAAVVLLMGTNDLEEKAEPETIAANFELIIQALKSHNAKMPILVCSVFPSSEAKSRPADKIQSINELYAAVVKDDPQITVIDTWTLFADQNGDAKAEEFPDLLHPNELGYSKWAKALRTFFATLGLMETEAAEAKLEPGFESLFNGKDLTGWCIRPTTPEQRAARERWHASSPDAPPWPIFDEQINLDGQTTTADGRYQAIHGRLVATYPPEGRKIQQLYTQREFPEDFVLRLEFRASPNADSGVFVRDPQLQCRDYILAGPYKNLKAYRPQEWNDLEIVVTGNTAKCTCNGEVLEAELKLPDTGPIGLEGDRGQMEFRNIRISIK